MQLTNSATIVDYFPEAFIAEAVQDGGMIVTIKRFVKRVHFRANGMKSYSVVGAIDAKHDWSSRIANGAEVTEFNTDKLPREEYMPMVCWFMSLIKNYLHIKMTETTDNIIDRDELQKDLVDRIVDGLDMEMLCQLACDALSSTYDEYTVDELIAEVEEYYPDLLEEIK